MKVIAMFGLFLLAGAAAAGPEELAWTHRQE
jgi:hypothetical protein